MCKNKGEGRVTGANVEEKQRVVFQVQVLRAFFFFSVVVVVACCVGSS